MGASSMVGIKQIVLTPSGTNIMVISIPERPYGFLIATDDDSVADTIYVIRMSGSWTTYNGGVYAGGGFVAKLANGNQDHWQLNNDRMWYDETSHEFHIVLNVGNFRTDRHYYMWYYTMPF